MKNILSKSLVFFVLLGAFSAVSFAQTQLNLEGNSATSSGSVSSKSPVEYKVDLNESKLVCVQASSGSTIKVTFDGNQVTPNSQSKQCFETTRTGSYSIKITTDFKSADFAFKLNFTDILKWDERGIALVNETISGNQIKTFNVKFEAGKKVCFIANTLDLKSNELQVFLNNTKYLFNATKQCSLTTTETRFYEIVVKNLVAKDGTFTVAVSYQQN